MKYRIKIFYQTGDSFGSEDRTEYLEMEWDNLDVAKANLQRIKEHYTCYKISSTYNKNYFSAEERELFDIKHTKDWFVSYRKGSDDFLYTLRLKSDQGNDWQLSAYWCGYFEHLYSAEIEIHNSDLKITF